MRRTDSLKDLMLEKRPEGREAKGTTEAEMVGMASLPPIEEFGASSGADDGQEALAQVLSLGAESCDTME